MSEATPPVDDDEAALAELVAKDLAAVRKLPVPDLTPDPATRTPPADPPADAADAPVPWSGSG